MFKPSHRLITLPLLLALGCVSGFAVANQPTHPPASAQKGPKYFYTGQHADSHTGSHTGQHSGHTSNHLENTDSTGAKQRVKDARDARTGLWSSVCAKNKEANADGRPDHCQ